MSESKREKSTRKKKVSETLGNLSKAKKQESRLDQFEAEEVDETILKNSDSKTKNSNLYSIHFLKRKERKEQKKLKQNQFHQSF
jgi:hypothetical protein